MSKIHVSQIQKVFKDLFEGKIDIDPSKSEKEQADLFFTKSLAAYTVKMLSTATVDESISAITDGFNDNGIDFIHIDHDTKQFLVGQSKWTYEGQKSPELGDVLKTIRGFNDLLDCKFEKFNDNIKELKPLIESAISDTGCTLLLAISYSGAQPISQNIIDSLNELKEKLNDISEVFDYKVINLSKLYQSISYVGQGLPINVTVNIDNYGKIDEPYKALYGCVDAMEIFNWYNDYGTFLFEKNLRKFIFDSNINNTVQNTLLKYPEKFWYFNNGITVLCNKITQAGKGAHQKNIGTFALEAINVVNGAQTCGNIYRAHLSGSDISNASVMIKIISLEDCEDDVFANEITKYTNSQNKIENKDFVTLDVIHERLYKELRLSGIKYLYKTGDKLENDEEGFSFEDAIIALACANDSIRYAMLSKTSVGKLWESVDKPPYTLLFNSRTTGLRVYRSVQILFLVQTKLSKLNWYGTLPIHSNRFILHMVFHYIPVDKFDDPDFKFEHYYQSITSNFDDFFRAVKKEMDALYPNAHIYHFFRNGAKCADLKNKVLQKITRPF